MTIYVKPFNNTWIKTEAVFSICANESRQCLPLPFKNLDITAVFIFIIVIISYFNIIVTFNYSVNYFRNCFLHLLILK